MIGFYAMRALALTLAVSAAGLTPVAAEMAAPTPAQATPKEAPPAERRDVPLEEFIALSDGKTIYFELEDGTFWGKEYYVPGTQNSVFVFADGQCFEGYWRRIGPRYCYFYRDQPSCWLHFWEGDQLTVVSRDGMVQRVTKIAEQEPLSCDPALISGLMSVPAGG